MQKMKEPWDVAISTAFLFVWRGQCSNERGTAGIKLLAYFEAQPQNINHHALSTTASAAANHIIARLRCTKRSL
ncbi:hypothetical protein LMG28614_05158 [Paraburkholderia ultramafica]|uniref:Uncharacterized protein n=1 Tax=Paraburkholderia ultramafica TaxID=1544867 RepID=A0A6S7CXN4_9BURK|nr:hypothetical protein LMG28614_05158 [Paraburkholderia ultramafica]